MYTIEETINIILDSGDIESTEPEVAQVICDLTDGKIVGELDKHHDEVLYDDFDIDMIIDNLD